MLEKKHHRLRNLSMIGAIVVGSVVVACSTVQFGFPSLLEIEDLNVKADRHQPVTQDDLPLAIQKMLGQTVRMRGSMFPTGQKTGISSFILIGESQEPTDKTANSKSIPLNFAFGVMMPTGKTVTDFDGPIQIEGRLSIREVMEDDVFPILYVIEDADVTPAKHRNGRWPAISLWGC